LVDDSVFPPGAGGDGHFAGILELNVKQVQLS
jgi:hypothetical protein